MTTVASSNTPLPPNKRRPGRSRRSRNSPRTDSVATRDKTNKNTPPKSTSFSKPDEEFTFVTEETVTPCCNDILEPISKIDENLPSATGLGAEDLIPDTDTPGNVAHNNQNDSNNMEGNDVCVNDNTNNSCSEGDGSHTPTRDCQPALPMLSPAMLAHMKAVLSGSGPPSPPMPPQPPPSPPAEVFAPSPDLLDLAITGKALRPALDSPTKSPPSRTQLMLDRVQFSPGMLFDPDYQSGLRLSPAPTPAFLAAQLKGDRPVHCSPVRAQIRRALKKRCTLSSIVEGEEPPSNPQFPVTEDKISPEPELKRERTPTKRHQEEAVASNDLEQEDEHPNNEEYDDDALLCPTKIDFANADDLAERGLEAFKWQLEEPDMDVDPVSRLSAASDTSPVSQFKVSLLDGDDVPKGEEGEGGLSDKSEDSCTEEDYSKFAIAAEEEPEAGIDLHVTPRGRRVPLFSRTPEWTEMLRLREKSPKVSQTIALVDLSSEPLSPVLSPSSSVASLSLEQEGDSADELPDPAEGLASEDASATLSALHAELLPLSAALSPPAPSPLHSGFLPSSSLTASASATTTTIATATASSPVASLTTPPSSPWPRIFLTPPPFTLPVSLSQPPTPPTSSPRPTSKVRWRIATPIVGAPSAAPPRILSDPQPFATPTSPSPPFASPSKPSGHSPLGSSSKSAASSSTADVPSSEPRCSSVNSSSLASALLSSSSSSIINSLPHFELPQTPILPRSPPTPSTPLSPIQKVDITQLLLVSEEEPEEPEESAEEGDDDAMDFCFPDVSAEIQTRSNNILLSVNAIAQGHFGVGDPAIGALFDEDERSLDPIHSQHAPDKDDDNSVNDNTSSQFSLRDSLLADPELKQGSPNTNNLTQQSFFGTMTPLSPLKRPDWAATSMPSPQIMTPGFANEQASPDFEKKRLSRQVAELERELLIAHSTKEQLAQAFGEAQTQLRASEMARHQEKLFIRKLKSSLESFPPMGSPPADGRRLRPRSTPSPSNYVHVTTPIPPRASPCRSSYHSQPVRPR